MNNKKQIAELYRKASFVKAKIIALSVVVLSFMLMTGCNSKTEKTIPIELEFEGEISQYYSVQNATIKFENDDSYKNQTRYNATVEFDLVRNDKSFALDPSNYNYLGSVVVGLGSDPKSGEWCMFVEIQNAQHDFVGRCCGSASKLFEYYKSSGDVCHLIFDTSIDDIWRKGTTDDVKDFLEEKQQFFFYLKGPLSEKNGLTTIIDDVQDGYSDMLDVVNDDDKYVVINATSLRLRYGPSMDAETYKQSDGKNSHPNKGDVFKYLGEKDDFYNIDYHGKSLWVSKQYTYLSYNNTGDVDESEISIDNLTDWDKLLDEYENYANQYIKFYKQAMNGDMSAMTEYEKLLEKAEKLSNQLENAQDELTNAQVRRYLNITQKMTNVLSD